MNSNVDLVLTLIFAPLTIVVLVGSLTVVSRRLIGVRIGLARTAIASVFAYSLSASISGALLPRPDEADPLRLVGSFVLILGLMVLVAVLVLGIAETLIPTGSWPGVLALAHSIRRWLRRSRRYSAIVAIAVRHGLGRYLRGRGRKAERAPQGISPLARALRDALDEGGVTFVKLGQLLSTRSDLLPEEFTRELAALQDRARPVPWPDIERMLAEEFGTRTEQIFAEIDEAPLAAASIAQVHRARLKSGEDVIIKVQRPGIVPIVRRDLDIVDRIARMLESRTAWGRNLGLVDLATGFAAALEEELDFRIEARNLAVVRAASDADHGNGQVRLPAAYPALSTGRVLVQQRLVGAPLVVALDASGQSDQDRRGLARDLLDTMLRQVMLHGVFHADPHPGNILLLEDGRLGLLDFGSVGRIDGALRGSLQQLLMAIERGDPAGLRDSLLDLVSRPEHIDELRLERSLGQFMARHFHGGGLPDAEMFTDLFRLVSSFGLAVPPEIAAVFRALATLEGTLVTISPGFDIVAEARHFAASQITEQLQPGSVRTIATNELVTLLPVLRRLPRRIDRISGALENGRLGFNVRLFADRRDRAVVTELVHRVVLAFTGAAIGLIAVLLIGTSGGPRVSGSTSLYEFLGYNLLVLSAVLLVRVVVTVLRGPRMTPRRVDSTLDEELRER